jgi:hypothetical protein
MDKNLMNPLKVYKKGNEKTNSLIKSYGKLNCGELSFLSGNTWKHITEMSAKVFLELTLKVRLITSEYIMACSGQEVKLALKTLPKAGIRSRPKILHQVQK